MRVAIIAPVKERNIKKIGNQRVNSFDLLHFPKIFSPIKVARCHFQVGKMTHAFQVNLELHVPPPTAGRPYASLCRIFVIFFIHLRLFVRGFLFNFFLFFMIVTIILFLTK